MIFESHTDVARVQQIWKYIPQRLSAAFPHADFYLIVDDDVFINARLLEDFVAHCESVSTHLASVVARQPPLAMMVENPVGESCPSVSP